MQQQDSVGDLTQKIVECMYCHLVKKTERHLMFTVVPQMQFHKISISLIVTIRITYWYCQEIISTKWITPRCYHITKLVMLTQRLLFCQCLWKRQAVSVLWIRMKQDALLSLKKNQNIQRVIWLQWVFTSLTGNSWEKCWLQIWMTQTVTMTLVRISFQQCWMKTNVYLLTSSKVIGKM